MKYSKKLFILLVAVLPVLILMIFLWPETEGSHDFKDATDSLRNEEPHTASVQNPVLAQPTLDPERSRHDRGNGSEAIWATGQPSPVLPVVRGVNRERQFGIPVTRELPEVIENSAPALMAMIPEDGREALLPEETDLHTLRGRRMVLNTSALERIVNGETNHLLVPTPGSEVLDLKIERIRKRTKQTHSLIGKISGEALSDVNIVYHDGIIHGTVARYDANQHFEYSILTDGYMMVRELDTVSMTDRCAIPEADADAEHSCDGTCDHAEVEAIVIKSPMTDNGPSVEADTSGWTTIDVVVGYGTEARIAQGGVSQMEAHIIAAVDRMTDAFANSLVTNTEMMLLGTIEDPNYVFPGSSATEMDSTDELGDLNDELDGILDTVSDYSTLLGADLTSFVVKQGQGETAGIASRPGRASIVARNYMNSSSMTFAHELAHNLGAQHSLGDANSDNVLDDARYGLRFEGASGTRYRTIMAYTEVYGGTRIPHYANPNVHFDGSPTGVNDGDDLDGNTLVDPIYESLGFDGSNPQLGARNAEMFLVQSGDNGVVFAANRSTRAALAVTSPTVGVQWAAGSSQTISFTGGDLEYTADIDLYKGGVYQATLADDINAINRYFTWEIPLVQDGGNDYQIRVTLTHAGTNATSFVESGFFVIQNVNDFILESPIGGETWTRNTKQNITWSSSYGGNVKIELKKGASAPISIVESTPDDGSFEWTIPFDQTLDSDYRIILTSDVSPFDSSQSAGDFTISAPSNDLLVTNLDTNPGFTTSGEFAYGIPLGPDGELKGNGASSPYSGTKMYDTNLADSSFDSSSLTTYAIDCSNHTNIILDFWAYIIVGSNYTAVFEISIDNSNWSELETIGHGGELNRPWTHYTYDITDLASGESNVYIRWSMLGSGSQITSGGLSIDDISITGDFIPADGFSITSPNGGESFNVETVKPITWLSDLGGNVRIELLKNGSIQNTLANSTPNDGTFYWLVPVELTLASDYKIRITSIEDGVKLAESDSNFTVSALTSTIFSTTLDTDPGFSVFGEFEFGAPGGNNLANSPHTGSNMYDSDLDDTATFGSLTTMVIDCSSHTNVSLNFWAHRFMHEGYTVRFEVSNDNTNWVELQSIPGFLNYAQSDFEWKEFTYDISSVADLQSTVYVRWSLSGSGRSWGGQGLAIDDISITGTVTPASPTYDTWAQGPAPDADNNDDGLSNAVAWVLGATDPSETMTALAPTVDNTSDATYLIFTYRRSHLAQNDRNSTVFVEYGSDLTDWTEAVHDNDSIIVSETLNHFGAGVDRVQVKVKRSLAVGTKLFARLKVQVPE